MYFMVYAEKKVLCCYDRFSQIQSHIYHAGRHSGTAAGKLSYHWTIILLLPSDN